MNSNFKFKSLPYPFVKNKSWWFRKRTNIYSYSFNILRGGRYTYLFLFNMIGRELMLYNICEGCYILHTILCRIVCVRLLYVCIIICVKASLRMCVTVYTSSLSSWLRLEYWSKQCLRWPDALKMTCLANTNLFGIISLLSWAIQHSLLKVLT